jgi:RNA polymerase sigma factor (sigma-70 family)
MTSFISLLLADDHPLVLEGLRSLLAAEKDVSIVASCCDGLSALQRIRDAAPMIAVLDLRMPGLNGLEVLEWMTTDGLSTRVIFLGATMEDAQIRTAVQRGAFGIILKDEAPENLVRCIREVANGRRWFPSELVKPALEREERRRSYRQQLCEILTPREREALTLVAQGLSNGEIAREFNISEGTVKIHIHKIYQKLRVGKRSTLADIAALLTSRQDG